MTDFIVPKLSYVQLSPILIVLGGALIGVLIEAFFSRKVRPIAQLTITLGSLILALIQLWHIRHESSLTAAMGSVAIDGATILMQGSILLIAILAVALIADNEHFTVLAAAVPGSPEERDSLQSGEKLTEVFPLTLFAVAGMLLFPASNDLITLFVALEMLSLPLYLLSLIHI